MNVLYYLGQFPKLSESFVLNEIYELEKQGHDVAVCALGRPEELTHEEYDSIEAPTFWIDSLGYGDALELLSPAILRPQVLRNALFTTSMSRRAENLLQAKRCIEFVDGLGLDIDHVHTHLVREYSFGAKHVASHFDVPFTITAHAVGLYDEPVGGHVRPLLRSCDRIVTISEYNATHIRDRFVDDTPIDVVRAGIRPEKFRPRGTPEPNRILTVSRFVEKKGLEYGVKALDEVARQVPDVEYHLVGSGPRDPEIRSLTDDLGLASNVRFLGHVDDDRLRTEYSEARCFLLPCVVAESGDRDGIPVALMEAMATRTPPVSTTVSGIPELIDDGYDGLLVEPRDPEATASAVLAMLRNDSEWAAYRDRARRKVVNEFNITDEVRKLETVFRKCRSR